MKKFIIVSFLASLLFFACRKSDNPKLPELTRVPTPNLSLDPSSNKFIPPGAPASFKAKINIDLKFKDDVPPKKMDAVIIKNGNKAAFKVLKADITTFPSSVDITGQQLIDLFGPIADGDLFQVGVDITTQGGQVFQAFPLGGVGYGTGVANEAGGVTTSIQFIKPCTFVASAYAGNFEVVSDEWADYKAGAVIPVKLVSPTQISFEYAVDPGTAKPIILTINPADNSISVAKQVYGSYGGDVFSAESVPGASSAVNPCDLSLSVKLLHTGPGVNNSYTIKLKKK
jgi:hypothetical protein